MRAHLEGQAVSPLFIPMAMDEYSRRRDCRSPRAGRAELRAGERLRVFGRRDWSGFRAIRDGYASACLVGGAESAINPVVMSGFASLRALSQRNDEPARERAFHSRPIETASSG